MLAFRGDRWGGRERWEEPNAEDAEEQKAAERPSQSDCAKADGAPAPPA